MTQQPTRQLVEVTGGVDTHKDMHVAAALDPLGRVQGTSSFPVCARGYVALTSWLATFGPIVAVGVEGTSSYGAGLLRHMNEMGLKVIEVSRPNRQLRRSQGKSDTIDAIAAARAVQAGTALGIPKSADGAVESIRMLRVARRGAMKARSQAAESLHDLFDTGPEALRAQVAGLPIKALVDRAFHFRPGPTVTPLDAAKRSASHIARRWLALDAEIAALDAELVPLVAATAPSLVALPGVGTDTAGALLVAAGDNPERLRSDACFAKICGVSPLPASSGRTVRHRLNRGGNREANSALWRIVLVRLGTHQPTKDYMARRRAEGLTKREVMRCLKRYVARQVFKEIVGRPVQRSCVGVCVHAQEAVA